MTTALTNENWTCGQAPDSPDYHDKEFTNSDDLEATSNLYGSSLLLNQQAVHQRRQHLVIVGSFDKSVTLGRGGASTVKIGRRNRQISRIHVSITYSKENEQFELLVVGLNGACVDQIQYAQHQVAALENDSFIDILGDHFYFKVPPSPINFDNIKPDIIVNKKDIFRELSPEAEEVVQEEEEEEEYPAELVPEDPLSSEEKELSPDPPVIEEEEVKETCDEDTNDYAEVIIDALVFSRTSSMPISDICSRILKGNPTYAKQPRALWIERIRTVLKERPFFGEIQRKGKTADGSPTENLYYYNSELDPVEWRRSTYTQVGRSARKCTLKDKQYFWKIPPKLGRHRSAYIPPPANDKRQRLDTGDHQDENVDPKKTRY
ncbi:uncharacterized protein EV154DRAFT_516487 [Mucor mucedo]|uniref:uncharacterized protein n=1 Tax=Mucor mucedo TaxID=29922 RepID=UPI00221E8312|nr:uncharacterized protein EV154DRAFT_516487 [Mucor mucedo]KAI7888794.1 hypothetical protein EV154DRAFT_516487 [Mucor mucedo]